MLYRFKSKAGADVVMLGESGDALLRLLGREPAAKGIFESADLPSLIQALEAGVAAEEALHADQPETRRAGGVSLRQRAWPLRELMLHSQRAGVAIVWGV